MTAKLDCVAIELAAIIGSYLAVAPLCSLRLVSKPVKRLFTPMFRPYLQNQAIDLTRSSLVRLCELAANEELSSAVYNLRLVCLFFLEENSTQKSSDQNDTGELDYRTFQAPLQLSDYNLSGKIREDGWQSRNLSNAYLQDNSCVHC
jgi:hypothetical protein